MKKILFLLLVLFLLTACGGDQVEIDGEMVKLDDLKEMVAEEQETLTSIEEEINRKEQKVLGLEIEFQDREAEFNELVALSEERESLEDEVIQLRIERDDLNREIENLTSNIVEVKDEPIKVGAGYFYFGDDIETGRYELKAQDGYRGNIFVRRSGISYVSDTFGKPRSGDGEELTFIFSPEVGDEIEATVPFELYPVE